MPLLYTERSLDFDGSNDCVDMGDVPELSFERTDAFTWSFWAKYPSAAPDGTLMSKQLGGVPWRGIALFSFGSGLLVEFANTNGSNYFQVRLESSGLDNNQWHHIVMTYDGSGQSGVSFYIDGELRTNVTLLVNSLSDTIITTATFRIGSRNAPTTSSQQGRITEAAVYDSELTPSEVLAVYNAGSPPDLTVVGPTANLVGYWRLGEHSYPTVPDLSASGNDGTMTNMVVDDIVVDAPRPHESFYSLLHDYSGTEYVTMGDIAVFEFGVADTFSISTWVKFSRATTSAGHLVSKIFVGPTRGWGLHETDGDLLFIFQGNSGWSRIRTTGGDYRTGEWRHVVVTYGGTSNAAGMNIYVDGVLQPDTTENDTLGGTTANTAALNLMSRTNGTFSLLGGAQTETSIWTKELTSGEVLDLYNSGVPRDVRTYGWNSTLLGYWSPNPQNFPTVPDLTGNGYNGTATNMEARDVRFDAPGIDLSETAVSTRSCNWGGSQSIVGWVDLGTPSELAFERTQPFSLSLWVRYTGGGTLIGNLTDDSTSRGWELYIDPPYGNFNVYIASDGDVGNELYVYTDFRYDDNEWHHVTIIYQGDSDPANLGIYVDGVSVPFTVDTDNLSATIVSAENVKLGKTASEDLSYDGYMDEVSIWNKALSEAEVRTLYGASRSPSNLLETMPVGNLVGYWKMGDGDTFPTLLDYGPFGLDGTMAGYLHTHRIVNDRPPTTSLTQYSLGNGGRYDATDTRFDFGKADPFSLVMWFRTDADDTTFPSMASHQDSLGYLIEMQGNGGENPGGVSFRVFGPTGEIRVSTDTAYNDGVWRQLVVTYDGTGVGSAVTFYINGSPVASTVHEDTLAAEDFYEATPYSIYDAVIAGNGFIGSTCQHAVYDKELTAGEVTTIYGGGTPPNLASVGPTGNLVAWWPILDTDLPNLPNLDDAGPNDITMVSFTTAETIVEEAPAPLVSTYSIDFDGADDYVDLGANYSFERTDTFTLMAWIKVSSAASHDGSIISKLTVGAPWRGWHLGYNSSYKLKFLLTSTNLTNEIFVVSTGVSLNDNQWRHVAVTYDGSSKANGVRLYINGVLEAVSITVNNLSATTINALDAAIGQANGTSNFTIGFQGLIDEVAIYNRALAPSEVALLGSSSQPKDQGAVGPVDSLIGWWRMGEPGPSVFPNIGDRASASQNTGTMVNMVSGDIVLDAESTIYTSFLLYTIGTQNVGPGIEYVGVSENYNFVSYTPTTFFKMRALADPGPGYVTWISDTLADYTGTFAPTAIQASSAVVADQWVVDETFITSNMSDRMLSTVSSAVTLVNPQYGVLFVGVDTSQGTWNDLDVITLPASVSKGVEIILKDIGGQADTKRITVSGDGNPIDGNATRLITNAQESLHLVFGGTQWSII